MIMIVNPTMSFAVKYGWNGILSVFLFSPSGLFDPVWCKNSRWIIVIAAIANGIRKCSAKNRIRVALSGFVRCVCRRIQRIMRLPLRVVFVGYCAHCWELSDDNTSMQFRNVLHFRVNCINAS
jgi:hypothetical protein